MATVKLSDSNLVSGWNSKMDFPKDNYTLRCLEEEIKPSKNGHPMVHLTWEICRNEPVQFGNKLIDVDGLKIEQYILTKHKKEDGPNGTIVWDAEKSAKALGRYCTVLRNCGFDLEQEIDDENPPSFFKGKVVDAVVYARKDVSRKSPTAEQAKKGLPGDVIKDPFGKEVATYQLQVDQIFGLSSVDTNKLY